MWILRRLADLCLWLAIGTMPLPSSNVSPKPSTGNTCACAAGKLPCSFADLRQLGVDETILDILAALVAGDVTEEMVVRAFLEALEPAAKQAGVSRQLLRALRNQFKTADECAELRAAVAAIVAAPIVAGSPAP